MNRKINMGMSADHRLITIGRTSYHIAREGTVQVAIHGVWLPGVFEDFEAAVLAMGYKLDDATLSRLQKEANTRAGGTGGLISGQDVLGEIPQKKGGRK